VNTHHNLDFHLNRALKKIRDPNGFHISNSDKNLGMVVRMKRQGMDGMYKYHISINVYKNITKLEAASIHKEIRLLIKQAFKPGCRANKAVLTYLPGSIKQTTEKRWPIAFFTALHKTQIIDRLISYTYQHHHGRYYQDSGSLHE
jgi:hypothetical protein